MPDRHDETVRHFDEADLRQALTWDALIDSQRMAFAALARGDAALAPRALLDYDGGTAFSYLARADEHGWPVVKFGSVNPGNTSRGLPSVHAYVYVLDRETGRLVASADGTAVTALRTPAGTIAALESLGDSDHVHRPIVIIGSGHQGRMHAEAFAERYPGRVIKVVSARDREAIRAALVSAATVVLCTSSFDPVIEAAWLQPGSAVVSIGAFAPDRHEFGDDLMSRAGVVYADDAATCLRQCGPIASAVASGDLDANSVVSIGDVVLDRQSSSQGNDDITVYVSVGLGVQDAAVMNLLMETHRPHV